MLAGSSAPEGALTNPFPGLRPFEPEEDHLFFGRERQVDELLSRLRRTHFLSVVGASGSGKSSLVRCGLIPSLYSGFMAGAGSSWRVAILRPGPDPVGALARALNAPGVLREDDLGEMGREILATTLRRSALGLVDAIQEARLPEGENLLVLVDQFEELFRFKREHNRQGGRNEALTFVRLLLTAAQKAEESGIPVYITLTMRSDFIGNCTEIPGLAEAINRGQYLIPRMNRDERRSAIEGPVAVAGAAISPRLVRQLLNDVGDNPDQLPILQHALMRTWELWEISHTAEEPLDLRHYEAVGRMELALSNHADEAFGELNSREQHIAEILFKALTDRDTEGRGVRRPTAVGEICALVERGDQRAATVAEVAAVVDRFRRHGRTFLVASADRIAEDTVLDISHESLMRTWRKLIDWVEEEAQQAQVYLRLCRGAEEYYAGTGSAWRDPELQLALNWQRQLQPTAVWAERYDPAFERALAFLRLSDQEHQREITERERQRQRQLRRAKAIALVAGLACLVVAAALLLALNQRQEAVEARKAAEDALLEVEEANAEVTAQKVLADQQKERAEEEKERAEEERARADDERQRAVMAQREADLQRRQAEANAVAAARKEAEAQAEKERAEREKERAEVAEQEAVAKSEEAERLRRLALAEAVAGEVPPLARQEATRRLAALLAVESLRLMETHGGDPRSPQVFNALQQVWSALRDDAPEGTRQREVLFRFPDAVRVVAVLPGGGEGAVLAAGDDGAVRRLELDRDDDALVGVASGPVRGLAVNAAGDRLGLGTAQGTVELWSLTAAGARREDFLTIDSGSPVTGAAFHGPAGQERLLTSHRDGSLRRWEAALEGELLWSGEGEAPQATAVAVAPRGAGIALATDGGGLLYWADPRQSREPRRIAPERSFHSVTFLPCDGGRPCLAAGTGAGESGVEVWSLGPTPRRQAVLRGHDARVTAVEASPDGALIATASLDGTLRLWQGDHLDAPPVVLNGHNGWIWGARFAARGERLVSVSADRTARLWVVDPVTLAAWICARISGTLTAEEWGEHMEGIPYASVGTGCDGRRTPGGAP
jgi:WD40 repeat protein/energy-coupling factor transporter ATP-binding protein EcfA2